LHEFVICQKTNLCVELLGEGLLAQGCMIQAILVLCLNSIISC
jgi:hypothetical protein